MMSNHIRKFFEPLSEPFTYETIKEHWILYILAPLGAIPIFELFKEVDSFWVIMGIIILWWIVIGIFDLLIWYFKNK